MPANHSSLAFFMAAIKYGYCLRLYLGLFIGHRLGGITQLKLLDFSGAGFRNFTENYMFGHFKLGQMLTTMLNNLITGQSCALSYFDEGHRHLSHLSLEAATTPQLLTSGILYKVFSISILEMFSPPEIMISLRRSIILI